MSAIGQRWQAIRQKYEALSRRERGLVAAALVLGPTLLGNALWLGPQTSQRKALQAKVATQEASLSQMQAQLALLQAQAQQDPDAGKKAELAALAAEQAKLDQQIRDFGAALVPPEEMNRLLERLLARQPGLRLVSLKTLAPQSVLAGDAAKKTTEKDAARVFDLYRHGVELKIEGSYRELQAYVTQLEKLDKRLLWGSLNYRVGDYPRAEMTLTVYTLSSERTWLAL